MNVLLQENISVYEPKIFRHPMFGELPVIIINGIEWFGATEAAKLLSFLKPLRAIENHVEEEDATVWGVGVITGKKADGSNATQTVQKKFINESGLYDLIFGASRQGNNHEIREKAKKFKRWVTSDVLPTIRMTGGYVADDSVFIQTYLPFADDHTKSLFRATLESVRIQNEQIAVMKPKAEYFDALIERNLLTNFRDTAKELHIKQNEFIEWLMERKYVFRDQSGKLKPYSKYVPDLFQLKEWGRNKKVGVQTLITPKGRETFRLLLQTKKEGVK
ncbi:phage antirepressor KilAC domain-containing protein [Viridibacillus arvi]|uniref:phage antirepressor KilAC domain-containing protein n=1 Tax=Viridibacillus arvi TaxID=263475 RepID=UPI003D2E664A